MKVPLHSIGGIPARAALGFSLSGATYCRYFPLSRLVLAECRVDHDESRCGAGLSPRTVRAGAAGYLTKRHTPEELADAIRRVYRGHKYVTESLAEKLAFELEPGASHPPHEALSDREYQVFRLLGSGKSVGSIAAELALSPKTVSTYRTRILEKMHFVSNTELIRYVIEKGLGD